MLARQLLKAGSSITTNVSVAQLPEFERDFVNKLKIAEKEASELVTGWK